MRVKKIEEKVFRPFKLELTVQTEAEQNALYCIFNYGPLMDFCVDEGCTGIDGIRDEIGHTGYMEAFSRMEKHFK